MLIRNLDVIIPVYRGLDETKECIYSLLSNMPQWAQLIVINDSSPEPELTNWLRQEAGQLGFELYENESNKGFVGTVNFGMSLNKDRDVLLLNSDVEVSNLDWLNRMRKAAYSHERVASLTPFSNNATICSFPHFCQDNELYCGLDVNALDHLFSTLPLENELVEVPTGVGFCMYIRRDCLEAIGYFDEDTFGKGYGEENDWCQRAIKNGWINYHQLNVFAYHKGGVSFQAEGDPRKEKALELLTALHPNYITDVHKFIANDPAKKARVLAKIEAISNLCVPKIVLVTHRLGGGVSQHIDELCDFFKKRAWFIKLEPEKDGESIAITLDLLGKEKTDKLIFNVATQSDELVSVLSALGINHFHFHHTMGIHPFIWSIPKKLGVEYDITIHDYYMINGNPTLTDGRGIFVGENLSTRDSLCAEHYPIPVTAEIWREGVKPLLSGAKRVIFPSSDCANRFTATFDYIKDKTIISYHPDALSIREHIMATPVTLGIPDNRALRVLVLGALSREKGANLLERVAKECPEIEFHLLGYAYRPLDAVICHGAYNQDNLDILIEHISPDIVWFPALWPETYSYTLSIALRHNMPVICPNIGAFPERIVGRKFSFLVPWNYKVNEFVAYFIALSTKQMDSISIISENIIKNMSVNSEFSNSYDFYTSEYVESINVSMMPKTEINDLDFVLEAILKPQYTSVKTIKEEVLIKIWALRNSWVGRRLANMVPFHIQRKIKRYLSHKPLHDIL
ncbi:glycosyltransferase [Aeromonas sp. R10-2]|uniref:glycosyltransferase n=1 Tax=Aeromonas sp. R10-2 TaxID=3138458 RepID=UPI0034A238C7